MICTMKHEGIFCLWRGNLTNLIRFIPSICITFICFDIYKNLFNNSSSFTFILCGSLSGTTSTFIMYPINIIKTKYYVEYYTKKYKNYSYVCKDILYSDGIDGFYKHSFMYLLSSFLYRGFQLGIYDTMRYKYPKYYSNNILHTLSLSYYSTLIGGFIALLFDNIRNKILLRNTNLKTIEYSPIYTTKHLIQKHGFFNLFIGFRRIFFNYSGVSILFLYYI